MAVYTGIIWVGNLMGVTSDNWLGTLLGSTSAPVSLYISWAVVQAIRDVERRREAELNGASLRKRWYAMAALKPLSYLLLLLIRFRLGYSCWNLWDLTVSVGPALVVVFLAVLICFSVLILFLMALWKSKSLYEGLPPQIAPEQENH